MLLIIRHATSRWNVPPKRCQGQLDVTLADEGRAAARRRGRDLPLPSAAYSSHLARAKETARILLDEVAAKAGRPSPPLQIDPRLAEASCGHWEGLYHSIAQRRWPETWSEMAREHPDFTFPGGERLGDVLARFARAIEEIDARHRDELALVVAHGGPMGLFLRERLGRSDDVPGGPPVNLTGFSYDGGDIEPRWFGSRPAPTGGQTSPLG